MPRQVLPGPWTFFTAREAEVVEAIVERLIPADDLSVSGKDAGCAVFIDRQLSGHYGSSERLYMKGPFQPGLPTQGDRSGLTPAARYRQGLKALPMRQFGSFHPGNGVGGAGVHWAGITWRFSPADFRLRSHYTERYGAQVIPADMTIQDWGLTYEEMEPYYDRFEYLAGVSGKAGNLNGQIQDGGNPFEGPRKREFPNPPMMQTYGPTLFAETAARMGYKPFPIPSSLLSRTYTNPLGVTMGQCTFCGFCTNYGCANYSKASAQTTVLPVLMRKSNFELRTLCEVLKVNLDSSGKKATGVTYVDPSGNEFEQPADLVILCAFMLDNVRLMLLSGIGKPYAGGAALQTPFGTLVAPNITPDHETGIGNWTEEDLRRTLRDGIGRGGKRLYPAMPYPAYTRMTDDDIHALWSYLRTLPPVGNAVEANQLPFPFNIRLLMAGWNLLNFEPERFKPDPQKSAEWNRGAYLVQALGHCGTCHTPKTMLGADDTDRALRGANLQGWYAPSITADSRQGVGGWTVEQLTAYLKTGVNHQLLASGPMAEEIQNSSSRMTDADLNAIATYLLDRKPPERKAPAVGADDVAKMRKALAQATH